MHKPRAFYGRVPVDGELRCACFALHCCALMLLGLLAASTGRIVVGISAPLCLQHHRRPRRRSVVRDWTTGLDPGRLHVAHDAWRGYNANDAARWVCTDRQLRVRAGSRILRFVSIVRMGRLGRASRLCSLSRVSMTAGRVSTPCLATTLTPRAVMGTRTCGRKRMRGVAARAYRYSRVLSPRFIDPLLALSPCLWLSAAAEWAVAVVRGT